MSKVRMMVVCSLVLVVMLFTTAQALAYTFKVKNQTSNPLRAGFYYATDKDNEMHMFNNGNSIAPGQTSTLKMDGVKCMHKLAINQNGWHFYELPGCGDKSFVVTVDIKITKDGALFRK